MPWPSQVFLLNLWRSGSKPNIAANENNARELLQRPARFLLKELISSNAGFQQLREPSQFLLSKLGQRDASLALILAAAIFV